MSNHNYNMLEIFKYVHIMDLSPFGIVGQAQYVIDRYIIKNGQFNQMPYRQLVGAPFVAGIHGLRGCEVIGDLLLCQIIVLTQISHSFYISHSVVTLPANNMIHFYNSILAPIVHNLVHMFTRFFPPLPYLPRV